MRLILLVVVFNALNAMECALDETLLQLCKSKTIQSSSSLILDAITSTSINQKDDQGRIPLHFAALFDTVGTIITALCKADRQTVGTCDNEGAQPLHLAAFAGNVRATHVLINYEANPNAQTKLGKTPAHKAIYADENHNAIEILELLNANKGNLDAQDVYGYTPLHLAALNENPEIFSALVNQGADFQVKDEKEKTPIMLVQEAMQKMPPCKSALKQKFNQVLAKISATSK